MEEPKDVNTTQHKRDKDAFDALKRKNFIAHITLMSNMKNYVMREFRRFENAKEMWETLVARFSHTSVIKLR